LECGDLSPLWPAAAWCRFLFTSLKPTKGCDRSQPAKAVTGHRTKKLAIRRDLFLFRRDLFWIQRDLFVFRPDLFPIRPDLLQLRLDLFVFRRDLFVFRLDFYPINHDLSLFRPDLFLIRFHLVRQNAPPVNAKTSFLLANLRFFACQAHKPC